MSFKFFPPSPAIRPPTSSPPCSSNASQPTPPHSLSSWTRSASMETGDWRPRWNNTTTPTPSSSSSRQPGAKSRQPSTPAPFRSTPVTTDWPARTSANVSHLYRPYPLPTKMETKRGSSPVVALLAMVGQLPNGGVMLPASLLHYGIGGPQPSEWLNRTREASRWFDMTHYRLI